MTFELSAPSALSIACTRSSSAAFWLLRASIWLTESLICTTSVFSSASAICSIVPLSFFSNPSPHDSSVVTTTAISTPGSLGAFFLTSSMMAMASRPSASVGQWASPTCLSTPMKSLTKCSLLGMDTPSSLLNCDIAMISAAALVKPTMTGCDRKLTITPSLSRPSVSCTRPTVSASRMASPIKFSDPGCASVESDEAVSSDTTATGPVPSCLELPHKAAMATGRKAAYSP